jgi:hypothetical protein
MLDAMSELRPGARLGEYVLEEPIGEGGFASVWRAHHHTWTERKVAAKVIRERAHADRLRAEADCLAHIAHPGIAGALGMDLDHDPPYLLVELHEGQTLRGLLKAKGKLTPAEAYAVFSQLAQALAHSHELGVCHGDLKPENVLIDSEGRVKLTDFGLGRVASSEASLLLSGQHHTQQEAALAGTIPYMAPEQRDGEPADPTSDVFSLGILLHEMLTGSRPQPGDDPREHLGEGAPTWVDVWERCFVRRDRRLKHAGQVVAAIGAPEEATEGRPARPLPPIHGGRGIWSIEEIERAVALETGVPVGELLRRRQEQQQNALGRLTEWVEHQLLGDTPRGAAARNLVWYLASEVMDVPEKELAERYGTQVVNVRNGIRAVRAGRVDHGIWRGVVDRLAPLPPSLVRKARRLEAGKTGRVLAATASYLFASVALLAALVTLVAAGIGAASVPLVLTAIALWFGTAQLTRGKARRAWVEEHLPELPGEDRATKLTHLALHRDLEVANTAREMLEEEPAPVRGPRVVVTRAEAAPARIEVAEPEAEGPASASVPTARPIEPEETEAERRARSLLAVQRAMAEAEREASVAPEAVAESSPEAGQAAEPEAESEPAPSEAESEEVDSEAESEEVGSEAESEEVGTEAESEEVGTEAESEEVAPAEPEAAPEEVERPAPEAEPEAEVRMPLEEAMRLREGAAEQGAEDEAEARPAPRRLEAN